MSFVVNVSSFSSNSKFLLILQAVCFALTISGGLIEALLSIL